MLISMGRKHAHQWGAVFLLLRKQQVFPTENVRRFRSYIILLLSMLGGSKKGESSSLHS